MLSNCAGTFFCQDKKGYGSGSPKQATPSTPITRDAVLSKSCKSAKHMTLMIFISTIVSLYIRTIWALHARDYGANSFQTGWTIGLAYILWAIGEIIWPTIGDYIGFDNVMTFTFIPSFLLYLCQAYAYNLTQLIITFLALFLVTPYFSVGWAYFAKILPHNKAVQFSSYVYLSFFFK